MREYEIVDLARWKSSWCISAIPAVNLCQWWKACARNVHGGAACNRIIIFQVIGQVILEKPNKKGVWGLAWICVGVHPWVLTYDRPETGLICFTALEWRDVAVSNIESSLLCPAFPLAAGVTPAAELGQGMRGTHYVQEQLNGSAMEAVILYRTVDFWTPCAVTAQFRCGTSAQMWECAFTSRGGVCTAESFSITRKPWSCSRTPVWDVEMEVFFFWKCLSRNCVPL